MRFIDFFSLWACCQGAIAATAPNVTGIHHFKVPVSNINASLAWYTQVMGAQRIPELDHINSSGVRYAVELQMPSLGKTNMELRLDAQQAQTQQGFDPITWGVTGLQELQQWSQWLINNNVAVSPVFTGVTGWLLVFQVCKFSRVQIQEAKLNIPSRIRTKDSFVFTLISLTMKLIVQVKTLIG